jgi:hypothetical protein
MIFAALVLLSVYLPTRAALQRATQYAATAISTELSDTWLFFDESSMSFYWESNKGNLKNVYIDLFSGIGDAQSRGEDIVIEIEGRSLSSKAGELSVECFIVNRIVYKEVVVTATRELPAPVDLSFIRFPATIPVTATSTAAVQNADEFIRNIDLAVDFVDYVKEQFNLTDISDAISSLGSKVTSLFGWY